MKGGDESFGGRGPRGILVLTADIEDWAQSTLDPDLPIGLRAERNTDRLLQLLQLQERKVTAFVLGKFAAIFPDCVKRIAEQGHEVASHGHGHVNVFDQSPQAFREDVRRSKADLEDLVGKPVMGYRSPDFSVGRAADWALEILAQEGYRYDSSIYPSRYCRNGREDWPAAPVRVVLKSGAELVELPMATLPLLGRRWPVAGGGYHRLLPWAVIRLAVERGLAENGVFVSYCHPYELDPTEMSEYGDGLSGKVRLHQGLGRRGFASKLRRLAGTFASRLASEVAEEGTWPIFRPQASS